MTSNIKSSRGGTSREYLAARIKRDHPDIAARKNRRSSAPLQSDVSDHAAFADCAGDQDRATWVRPWRRPMPNRQGVCHAAAHLAQLIARQRASLARQVAGVSLEH
jgi:hypothetical protein